VCLHTFSSILFPVSFNVMQIQINYALFHPKNCLSVINNHLSPLILPNVSICTRSSSGRYVYIEAYKYSKFCQRCACVALKYSFFFPWLISLSWPRPPRCWVSAITLRHTPLGKTPLDERSTRRRDLYLITHHTHKRQTSMPPVRTRSPNKWAAVDPRLRPRGHRDRQG
jgi:hypothetical protein